ncbi:DUF397 domain-containing protein [Actinomadura sp. RB99]|uniref:DUF397 domain-containing protein n=1 Tax=Actinomadura sp. RB99 TaxID=2691577 RepID=UPI0016845FC5|nr:DUF397 domain-containing protein [Actinomadura sp. RB99]
MNERNLSAARWRTSSYSSGQGTQCVEVASLPQSVGTRDSKDPAGPVLTFGMGEWLAFLVDVKRGVHDL